MGLNQRAIDSRSDAANNQLLAQGGGALGGALAQLIGKTYGPELKAGARGLVGLDKSAASPSVSPASINVGTDYVAPDFGGANPPSSMDDLGGGYPEFADFGGLDALAGFDPFSFQGSDPFDPYDYWSS